MLKTLRTENVTGRKHYEQKTLRTENVTDRKRYRRNAALVMVVGTRNEYFIIPMILQPAHLLEGPAVWMRNKDICGGELLTCGEKLLTCGGELLTCGGELLTCGEKVLTCGGELLTCGPPAFVRRIIGPGLVPLRRSYGESARLRSTVDL